MGHLDYGFQKTQILSVYYAIMVFIFFIIYFNFLKVGHLTYEEIFFKKSSKNVGTRL